MYSVPTKDYFFYDQKHPYNRKCIDGSVVGCGKCVGFCTYNEHPGFLTKEIRQAHNCIKKNCFHYRQKDKKKQPKSVSSTVKNEKHILNEAQKVLDYYEGIRLMRANSNSDGNWTINYITITNAYSVHEMEQLLSNRLGIAVTLNLLKYDFNTAAKLILN